MIEVPELNHIFDCHEPHVELLEMSTKNIWQSRLPLSRDEADALTLPEDFVYIGNGIGVMNAHYFRRSPGSDVDGPVTMRVIDGFEFIHCANPPEGGAEIPIAGGPQLLKVDKYHSLVFSPDCEVDVLCLPNGNDYIQVIAASPDGGGIMQQRSVASSEFELPDGWKIRTEKFRSETIVHLPHPTEAWFFSNGASFQGPVDLAT